MNDQPTHTLATDEATGSVRPADARYNRVKFTTEQLREIREQEIEDATVALLEQRKEEDAKNQEALDAAGYVNPTVVEEESPTARAFDKVYGSRAGETGPDSQVDSDKAPAAKKSAATPAKN